MRLRKIISGGQTGVDRGALDAALEAGFPCGGWCPEGRKAADGSIDARYPVVVLPGAGYRKRTIQNIRDSDGTVILCEGPPVGGSALTLAQCQRLGKPCLVIDSRDCAPAAAAREIVQFVATHRVETLNLAGPSEERTPGARAYAQAAVSEVLRTGRT